jgi:hypothetical protein
MVHPAARSLGSTRLFRVSSSDSDGKFVLEKTSGCDGLTAPKPSLFGYGDYSPVCGCTQPDSLLECAWQEHSGKEDRANPDGTSEFDIILDLTPTTPGKQDRKDPW